MLPHWKRCIQCLSRMDRRQGVRAWRASPYNVGPPLVILAQHIEEEEVHIIVQCLVVQEQLGQVAQVLAVQLLLLAIHLRMPSMLGCQDEYQRSALHW